MEGRLENINVEEVMNHVVNFLEMSSIVLYVEVI